MAEREITGRHVLLFCIAAFGVIIAVNVTMAYMSVSTFPGLEVKNSYVASQSFDEERAAQEALGWSTEADLTTDGLTFAITDRAGQPVEPAAISAKIGRSTHTDEDRTLDLAFDGRGYSAPGPFGSGSWTLFLTATAEDGTAYRQRMVLFIRPGA